MNGVVVFQGGGRIILYITEGVPKDIQEPVELMQILLVSILLTLSESFGCETDYSIREKLAKNPLSARSIVIGRMEIDGKGFDIKSFLRVEYSSAETSSRIKLKSLSSEKCDSPPAVNGGRFLLLSSNSLEKHQLISELGDSNNLFVEIEEAEAVISKIAELYPKSRGAINAAWKFCKRDNDCQSINICGKLFSINPKFENYYLPYAKSVCARGTEASTNTASLKCVDNLCTDILN